MFNTSRQSLDCVGFGFLHFTDIHGNAVNLNTVIRKMFLGIVIVMRRLKKSLGRYATDI
jgi:hypothetical protein